jgi:hypothetical protein
MAEPCSVTINGVTAIIPSDQPQSKGASLLGSGPWREVVYRVADWDAADAFIDGLFDRITYIGGPGSVISYPNPHQYPGNTKLVALDARADTVEPNRPGGYLFTSSNPLVRVMYGVPPYDIFGTETNVSFPNAAAPFGAMDVHGYSVNYKVPAGTIEEDGTGTAVGEETDRMVPHVDYTKTMVGIPYFYDQLLSNLVGRCNDATFFGKAPGTFRLDTYDIDDSDRAPDGSRLLRYIMRFIWRPYDWNYIPKAGTLDWVLAHDGSGNFIYPYANFTPLASGVY